MISLNKLLNNLSELAEDETFQFERLYRLLYNKEFYYKALSKIYSNKGSGTPGADGETVDGINEEKFEEIIKSLRDESYQPSPVKRKYVPKKKGTKRPVGLPTFTDKLVQEIVRVVLETIYEPIFSEHSHGFRPNRSCHTSLKEVVVTFKGASWFVEGDIKGCFDNIDHEILVKILKKRIKDDRFINLIRKFLRSGYLEDWQYHKTYSGCPQGSIIGPILANIYLNEFDRYMEQEIMPEFNHGTWEDRKRNPEYRRIERRKGKLKKQINSETDPKKRERLKAEFRDLEKNLLETPQKLPNAGEFRKVSYTRYADDWICGVIGSKKDCEWLKEKITKFFKEELNLELSEEKTLITHSTKPARFLGYEITVRRDKSYKKYSDGRKLRTFNRCVLLKMPKAKFLEIIKDKRLVRDISEKQWMPISRPGLMCLTDLEILKIYDRELRGIYNYYMMAENVSIYLGRLHYLFEYSCLKTLAGKHNSTVSKMIEKHRIGKYWGIRYETKTGEQDAILIHSFPRNKNGNINLSDEFPNNRIYYSRTELEGRLKARKCEICGKERPVEAHHVNKIKNLKGKAYWEKVMIAKKRKVLFVCHECHIKIHNGTL